MKYSYLIQSENYLGRDRTHLGRTKPKKNLVSRKLSHRASFECMTKGVQSPNGREYGYMEYVPLGREVTSVECGGEDTSIKYADFWCM